MNNCPLPIPVSDEDIAQLTRCFQPITRKIYKDETIMTYRESDRSHLMILREGTARVEMINAGGDVFLLRVLTAGDLFGAPFLYALDGFEYVVTAAEACDVVSFDYQPALEPCEKMCESHARLLSNLIHLSARYAREQTLHISILNQTTIRNKLMTYFKFVKSQSSDQDRFEIPVTFSQLAAYLCVDRSAMMREIKSLRDEGFLDDHRRKFLILKPDLF